MNTAQGNTVFHPFPPVYNAASRVLILGSFPSVASRAQAFYYGHPQNRFWRLLAALLELPLPCSIEEKKELLLQNHIALYDAINSCNIVNSADATIHAAVPTNLDTIFAAADIRAVFANGAAAYRVCTKQIGIPAIKLPSTSSANARFTFEDLVAAWKPLCAYLSGDNS